MWGECEFSVCGVNGGVRLSGAPPSRCGHYFASFAGSSVSRLVRSGGGSGGGAEMVLVLLLVLLLCAAAAAAARFCCFVWLLLFLTLQAKHSLSSLMQTRRSSVFKLVHPPREPGRPVMHSTSQKHNGALSTGTYSLVCTLSQRGLVLSRCRPHRL